MKDAATDDRNKHYCIQTNVWASFKKIKYKVSVMLHHSSGEVLHACCECKASSVGRCSHVAGVLFAIEDFLLTFDEATSVTCTSKLCAWNKGRKKKEPHEVGEEQYTNKHNQSKKLKYNPFPMNNQQNTMKVNKFCKDLQMDTSHKKTMWELLLLEKYSDYCLTKERKSILREEVYLLTQLLSFDAESAVNVTGAEQDTSQWHHLRQLLITASVIKSFVFVKIKQQVYDAVKNHLWEKRVIDNVYTQYGKVNEYNAFNEYKLHTSHLEFTVEKTGLWINTKYPGLVASPDGLVFDPIIESYGVIEIKCPFI